MEAFAEDWVGDDSMISMMQEVERKLLQNSRQELDTQVKESQQEVDTEVEDLQQEVETKVTDSQQPKILLSPEQQLVIDLVREGKVEPFNPLIWDAGFTS